MRDNTLRAAPFFPRAAAYLLDRLILGAVLFLPRIIVFFRTLGDDALSRAVLFRFTILDILWWALGVTYFVLLTASTGATLGKRAMGLAVVDKNGGRPAFILILCRETFGRYLSSLLCIGYLLCLADPEKGALHDRICDTRVVYAPGGESRPGRGPHTVPYPPAVMLPGGDNDWYAPNR